MSEIDRSIDVSDWLSSTEGKLSVDVIETRKEIIVRSAIAGIHAQDLDITLSDDTLTLRGERHHGYNASASDQVHIQECHWGTFSRTLILPCAVDPDTVEATLQKGILTIRLKKVEIDTHIPVLDLDDL